MITARKLNLTGLLLKIKELEQFQSLLFKNKHVARYEVLKTNRNYL